MIKIDGSHGEGGGQIIRSALALSIVTGKSFEIEHIRGNRKRPGLLKQHLTGVNAARTICHGDARGAELHSSRLVFSPGDITPGNYQFQIGSAGSTTLVVQTILPALMIANGESQIVVQGGTHNMAAPPFDFLDRCYLPLVERMGPRFQRNLNSWGFFPAGGGEVVFDIQPVSKLKGFDLVERVGKPQPRVCAIVSKLPLHIGERECSVIRRKSNWNSNCFQTIEVEHSPGPGNVVMIELISQNVTELFTGFGRRGIKAEDVARQVFRDAKKYLDAKAPVGEYLADQLLLPMGLAAAHGSKSQFRTHILSDHSKTHMDILRMFLDIHIQVEPIEELFEITLSN